MDALKLLGRLAISVVAGWFLLLPWVGLFGLAGMHNWGFFHSALPIPFFPIDTAVAFWALGYTPLFKRRRTDDPGNASR
jgi:hypothetical protein